MTRSDSEPETPGPSNFPLLLRVQAELCDDWTHDDRLLEKFFPVLTDDNDRFKDAWNTLFNKSARVNRWKRIPKMPTSLSKLCTPLTNLLNDILAFYGIEGKDRLFLDTHNGGATGFTTPVPIDPGIFFAGVGEHFASASAELPRAAFVCGMSILEVALDSGDLTAARDCLAVHMRNIFHEQINRRFAFGAVITQSVFIIYLFDHSGAIYSTPCDYHQNPEQFCAVVSGLAGDSAFIGLDTSVAYDGTDAKFRTHELDETGSSVQRFYIAKRRLFQSRVLIGRATTCCRVSRVDDPGSILVIKDSWIAPSNPPGRESEVSLVRHARSKGVTDGIVDIVHFEEIRHPDDASELDTVVRNRRIDNLTGDTQLVERVHGRTVMKTYGMTLDKFRGRKELLLAFHDAVLAHRKLHDVAGVLHRDISFTNILINPGGTEGNRGILIDFDHSIRVDDTSPYSTRRKIGTYRFMSRNVLQEGPHTYLDDLESFYYVLCWIVSGYDRPQVFKSPLPSMLTYWDRSDANILKDGGLVQDIHYPVSPWFGSAPRILLSNLWTFFGSRKPSILRPTAPPGPKQDYDEFLGYIRQAILELEMEPPLQATLQVQNTLETVIESGKKVSKPLKRASRGHHSDPESDEGSGMDDDSQAHHPSPRRPRKRKPPPIPHRRPRRSTANYGRNVYHIN